MDIGNIGRATSLGQTTVKDLMSESLPYSTHHQGSVLFLHQVQFGESATTAGTPLAFFWPAPTSWAWLVTALRVEGPADQKLLVNSAFKYRSGRQPLLYQLFPPPPQQSYSQLFHHFSHFFSNRARSDGRLVSSALQREHLSQMCLPPLLESFSWRRACYKHRHRLEKLIWKKVCNFFYTSLSIGRFVPPHAA